MKYGVKPTLVGQKEQTSSANDVLKSKPDKITKEESTSKITLTSLAKSSGQKPQLKPTSFPEEEKVSSKNGGNSVNKEVFPKGNQIKKLIPPPGWKKPNTNQIDLLDFEESLTSSELNNQNKNILEQKNSIIDNPIDLNFKPNFTEQNNENEKNQTQTQTLGGFDFNVGKLQHVQRETNIDNLFDDNNDNEHSKTDSYNKPDIKNQADTKSPYIKRLLPPPKGTRSIIQIQPNISHQNQQISNSDIFPFSFDEVQSSSNQNASNDKIFASTVASSGVSFISGDKSNNLNMFASVPLQFEKVERTSNIDELFDDTNIINSNITQEKKEVFAIDNLEFQKVERRDDIDELFGNN